MSKETEYLKKMKIGLLDVVSKGAEINDYILLTDVLKDYETEIKKELEEKIFPAPTDQQKRIGWDFDFHFLVRISHASDATAFPVGVEETQFILNHLKELLNK
jgi:hypothetical protein